MKQSGPKPKRSLHPKCANSPPRAALLSLCSPESLPNRTHLHSWNLTCFELKLTPTYITSTIPQISLLLLGPQNRPRTRHTSDWVGRSCRSGPNGNALAGGGGRDLLSQRVDMQIPGAYRLKNLQAQVKYRGLWRSWRSGWRTWGRLN